MQEVCKITYRAEEKFACKMRLKKIIAKNSTCTRRYSPILAKCKKFAKSHTVQKKTSVDEKEPNEALQVKRSTSEFGDFSSKACFILV